MIYYMHLSLELQNFYQWILLTLLHFFLTKTSLVNLSALTETVSIITVCVGMATVGYTVMKVRRQSHFCTKIYSHPIN